jgi:two-component system sensor histidine kinase ChiS
MKAKYLFLLLLFLLVFPATGQAQGPPTRFERISIEQGLSQVAIYCIFQDSTGLMWFGTEGGLNKYDGYTFTVYKRDLEDPHSLSGNTISSIYEDSTGALWIGTEGEGLNKFDRTTEQFTHYQHDPDNPRSLSDDFITTIYEDSSGTLWIGTEGGGLNKLVPSSSSTFVKPSEPALSDAEGFDHAAEQFSHYRHDPADPHSLSHDFVSSIYEDSSGVLWIGTLGGGLNKLVPSSSSTFVEPSEQALSDAEGLDRTTGKFSHYRHDPADPHSLSHDDVTAIQAGRDGALWIGTVGGLNKLDRTTEQFSRYQHDPADPYSLGHDEVTAIYEDAAGMLWVGTVGGLNEFNYQTQKFTHYKNVPHDPHSLSYDDINSIYEDSSGILWIGTTLGGLNKLDRKARRFTHYRHDPDNPSSLSSDMVWAIYEDSTGVLWVGTSGPTGGLNKLERDKQQFIHFQPDPDDPDSLGSTAVLVIYEDRAGALWVGSWDGGLSQLVDRETGQFIHYRHDPNDPDSLSGDVVWAIYEDSAGALWVGTFYNGLNKFDRVTGKFTHYRNDPTDPNSLSNDLILSIYEDQAGTLWVGTKDGLNKFNRQADDFTRYYSDPADLRTLSSNAVPAIYEDRTGTFWVGTDDGLNKFDRATESFSHYTEKDGLANDSIAGILEDDEGNLWISSSHGLSKFNPRTEEFKNYDERDGLQSDEFNRAACHRGQKGEMFFGGVNGFNAFYPANIKDNPHVPPVILNDFQIFNKPVAIGDASPLQKPIGETEEITLSYRDYVFSFGFAALDYTAPQKNQYAYILDGFDQDWNYVDSTRRFATYANLPAGMYNFRVKGSNNDGVWNEEGSSLRITITPPPWKTWWAYTIYAILGISAAAGFVRYRTRELERKHLEQTMWAVQKERDRITTLLESRRQLVASISHDLRTPVAIVRGHLESSKSSEVSKTSEVSLEVMLQELDRLQALLDDLFTLSRLEVDKLTLHPVPTDVVAVAQQAIKAIDLPAWQQGKVAVTLETGGGELWALADEQRLLQILMNLLHNGVRHTLPGGIVAVSLAGQPDTVTIKVQDTGEGISSADLPHIWERFYRGQSRTESGTGLGLALVKELTEAMGGTVDVCSTPGEGSCFSVTLPRAPRNEH